MMQNPDVHYIIKGLAFAARFPDVTLFEHNQGLAEYCTYICTNLRNCSDFCKLGLKQTL